MSDYQPIATASDSINEDNLIQNVIDNDDEQIKTKSSIISTNNISVSTSIDNQQHEQTNDDRRILSIDEISNNDNSKESNNNKDHIQYIRKESPRINIIKPDIISPRVNKVDTPRIDQPIATSRSDHQDMPIPSINPHNSNVMHPDEMSPRSSSSSYSLAVTNNNDHHMKNSTNIDINIVSYAQTDDVIELIVKDTPRSIHITTPRVYTNIDNNISNSNNIHSNLNTIINNTTTNNNHESNQVNHDVSLDSDTLPPITSMKSITAINDNDPIVIIKPTLTTKQLMIQRAKKTIEYYLEHMNTLVFMSSITMWALYDDDIRLSATTKSADQIFEIIITIIFFIFLVEIFLQSFYKKDYLWFPPWQPLSNETWVQTWIRRAQFGSFYFWLDWISTLSLIFEMPWMIGNSLTAGSQSVKASSAAKVARLVRVVRMVRLVRLIKLYKYLSKLRDNKNEVIEEEEEKGSQVGAVMSDLTNRRVIILLLIMLIIIPLLTPIQDDNGYAVGIQYLAEFAYYKAINPSVYEKGYNLILSTIHDEYSILRIIFNGTTLLYNERYEDLRRVEMRPYIYAFNGTTTLITFDIKDNSIQDALYSIYTTSFVIFLLMIGIYFFSSDVQRLVIKPIEHLVNLVRKVQANPLGIEYKMMNESDGFENGMETTYLLAAIIKIGGLMKVGFGEAGAAIIAKNLSESAGGKLNLMGSGTMIRSIFGFCDVRQFTDTTECLQEEVMLFVNRIAHILHSIVVQCSGNANKNIGDAFLLTWKLDENLNSDEISLLADQALVAFCKALIELSRYQNFICNFTINATTRLYKRFPDYNVRIGSGLHVGWAIEGAIGSNRKIDASYLSPHVNNTEYLESSTKQYGVPLLMSEPFYNLLSISANKYCRKVDRIRRSALDTDIPFCLYTYDSDLLIDWNYNNKHKKSITKNKNKNNKKLLLKPSMKSSDTSSIGSNTAAISNIDGTTSSDTKFSNGIRRFSQVIGLRTVTEISPRTIGLKSEEDDGNDNNDDNYNDLEDNNNKRKGRKVSLSDEDDEMKKAPTIVVNKYNDKVWIDDEDLVALRHNVNDSFRSLWAIGIEAYIEGNWQKARDIFNETMLLSSNQDGPSKFLITLIDEYGGNAPEDWPGYRADY